MKKHEKEMTCKGMKEPKGMKRTYGKPHDKEHEKHEKKEHKKKK